MKTKIVYVTTSSSSDLYLEQTWVSIYSARKKNPSAHIVLVVDSETDKTISGNRKGILEEINEKVVVNVPDKYNRVQASRYIKTNLRNLIKGDFLFCDSDTIITEDLDDIDNFVGDIGMVKDLHGLDRIEEKKLLKKLKRAGLKGESMVPYYNSGVIFSRDNETSHDLYQQWHNCWNESLKNGNSHYDQPPLAVANQKMGFPIKEMHGIWNCQIMNNGLPFLFNAKIIHYFATANLKLSRKNADKAYLFYEKKIFDDLKRDGVVSRNLSSMIDNAKGAFVTPCRIVTGNELILLTNWLHVTFLNYPRTYNFLNVVARCVNYIYYKIGVHKYSNES